MTVSLFFFYICLFSFRKDNKMRDWLETASSGQKGQTRGPASSREVDVHEQVKEVSKCFFTVL